MWQRPLTEVKKIIRLEKQYFTDAKSEIAEKNLALLKTSSMINMILLLFFYVLTPFVVKGWTITLQHFLFLPAALLFFIISSLLMKSYLKNSRVITGLCQLYVIVVFIFVILIDIFPYPSAPATFMPLIYVALPALFILPFSHIFFLMLWAEIVFIISVKAVKIPAMAENDIFNSLVGFLFALAVAQVILKLRSEDHDIRARYKRLSMLDALTGILNKNTCGDAIRSYLDAGIPRTCALLFIDLDNFKEVNDIAGHSSGDQLLEETGKLLISSFRPTDIIGRVGGDEFMVLIKDYYDSEDTLKKKFSAFQDDLVKNMSKNPAIKTSCSIGAVYLKKQVTDFDTLFRLADQALYEAKAAGKNRYVLRTYSKTEQLKNPEIL